MKRILARAVVGCALLSLVPAFAADHDHHTVAAADALTAGTIKKIDPAAGKITLAHGPLTNLGMPGMTMAFKAREPKMLVGFKEGEQVRFRAEDVGGALVIVHIEAAK